MLAAATAGGRPPLRPRLLARRARAEAVAVRRVQGPRGGAGRTAPASTGRSSARPRSTAPATSETLELFRMAKLGLMLMPPRGRLSLIHVDDLARLLLALAEPAAPSGILIEADDGKPRGWTHREFAAGARHRGRQEAGDRLRPRRPAPPRRPRRPADARPQGQADRRPRRLFLATTTGWSSPSARCPPELWQPADRDTARASPEPPPGTARRAGCSVFAEVRCYRRDSGACARQWHWTRRAPCAVRARRAVQPGFHRRVVDIFSSSGCSSIFILARHGGGEEAGA